MFYETHYSHFVENQNARNAKIRHTERNRTIEDLLVRKENLPGREPSTSSERWTATLWWDLLKVNEFNEGQRSPGRSRPPCTTAYWVVRLG